ncbi:MBL fold metallo-hydrolase [Bombilactobacillus thymidiniphilus]|uniref:MBL fold metallo-hydrolase n=1 Tax=Bombilactobacillus thymidiniphilus TaxID=2923363 RepID=A0ABY4PCK0_9LACO|nr:MBL fold metallo-hydrolase [Bombilactobacillus thymidiniphilus]UQS83272.1 MBL fold metallo-hydrolase [Bombilactobacillus thymidiniphilus]
MKITVLGYYGGYPYRQQATSGYLIQDQGFNLLLDCGSGVLNALQNYLDPLQLDAVVLTHYHHDHIADVGVLQHYWQLNSGSKKHEYLPIYGNTQDPLHFASLNFGDFTKAMPYVDYDKLQLGPFTLHFQKTIHPVPTFAVRIIDSQKKIFTFTADTAYFDGLIDFAQQSDLLITDTNFGAAKTGRIWHMTSTQSGYLAQQAHVRHLLLSHLPQEYPLELLEQEAKKEVSGAMVRRARTGLSLILS